MMKVYADNGDHMCDYTDMACVMFDATLPGDLLLQCKACNKTNRENGDRTKLNSDAPAPPGTYVPGRPQWNRGARRSYRQMEGPAFVPAGIGKRPAIGIHGGGLSKGGPHSPGVETFGCIRTTDSCVQELSYLIDINKGHSVNHVTIGDAPK